MENSFEGKEKAGNKKKGIIVCETGLKINDILELKKICLKTYEYKNITITKGKEYIQRTNK